MAASKDDRGHVWRKTWDGSVDMFAYDAEFHNGPVCEVCGYAYCEHCLNGPDEDCEGPPPPPVDVFATMPEDMREEWSWAMNELNHDDWAKYTIRVTKKVTTP